MGQGTERSKETAGSGTWGKGALWLRVEKDRFKCKLLGLGPKDSSPRGQETRCGGSSVCLGVWADCRAHA